jgi:hypothetical protein
MFYEWRIKHFQADFPDREFQAYRQWNGELRRGLDRKICEAVKVPTSYVGKTSFFKEVYGRLNAPEAGDADALVLRGGLKRLSGATESENWIVYFINLDDVFVFSRSDCLEYFEYLYYSGPDEVFIMNEQVEWIVSLGTMNQTALWLAKKE